MRGRCDALPEALLEEAAIWHARMRELELDPHVEQSRSAEFGRWLRADPRHPRAFAETERLWDTLEAPVAQAMADPSQAAVRMSAPAGRPVPGKTASRPVLAVCALLLFAGAACLLFQDDIIDRLRSDIRTAAGEHETVVLEEGSKITLNTATSIAVDLGPGHRRVRLLRGQAWFDVARDGARPFVVDVPSGEVRVTGTRFDVRLTGETAVVSLSEGRVELTSAAGDDAEPPMALSPGQQARVSAEGISEPDTFDGTAVGAWRRGQIVFYDTPLSQVVAELNRYRSGRIVVANSGLDSLKVSGVFKTEEPDAALSVIADTLPVRIIRLTDYLVILR